MHRFWDVLIRPVLDAVQPRLLVEIGAGQAATTRKLLDFCVESGAVCHSIDPVPAFDLGELQDKYGDHLVFHRARSLNVLWKIEAPDVVLIDGDHNWYTVLHELQLLEKRATRDGRAYPVCLLHDVDWPYGRRDLYYDPESIPPAFQQPYERKAIWPGKAELQEEGLNPHLLNAAYEHDLRNGVLTAIEDFMKESPGEYVLGHVGGLHGVGVLASAQALEGHPALQELLDHLRTPEFLEGRIAELETARQIAEIEHQGAVAAHRATRDRVAELEEQLELARKTAGKLASIEAARAALEQRLEETRNELLAAERRLEDQSELRSQIAAQAERQAEQLEQAARARKKLERAVADARADLQERAGEVARLSEAGELAARERLRVERELGRMRAELAAREEDRGRLRERIVALQQGVATLRSVHEEKVAEAERERAGRESALERIRQESLGRQAALRAAESDRASRDAALEQAAEERRERETAVQDAERARSERDAAVDLKREATQKEAEAEKARKAEALERAKLSKELVALRKRADHMRERREADRKAAEERFVRQSRDRQRLANLLAERNRELAKAERETARREDQLRAIAMSRSWRYGNRLVRLLRILSFRRPTRPDFGLEMLPGAASPSLPRAEAAEGAVVPAAVAEPASFPPSGRAQVSVDVIVCVRDALEDTRRCLASLYSKTDRDFRLILVDDGSAEATQDFLAGFAQSLPEASVLRRHDGPHGFALAANAGLRESDADYLVFLNSDTEVTFGWLERMIACGESDSRIGIVGPVSNAASHQSVPRAEDADGWAVNELPSWLPADGVSLLAHQPSSSDSARVPSINGFCYAVKREVVDAVGEFDEELFPDGYGAEDDYTYRARQVGFEAALATHAYVHHAKSRSFGPSARGERATAARQTLTRKHGEQAVAELTWGEDRMEQLARLRGALDTASRSPAAAADAVASAGRSDLDVLYVVPGVTHVGSEAVSVAYYSARALRLLGVDARVAVGEDLLRAAERYYPPTGELFCVIDAIETLSWATADTGFLVGVGGDARADVATSRLPWPTVLVGEVAGLAQREDPAAAGPATLTYSWARHPGSPDGPEGVLRVEPGVDESLFQPRRRESPVPRIVARLPEVQPGDALTELDALLSRLPASCELAAFGCSHDLLGAPGDRARVRQLGVLGPSQRARLLAGAQLFLDLRGGTALPQGTLEAMACGCVPVGGEPGAGDVYEAVEALLADPAALAERSDQARRTAEEFPLIRAGLSEYALFQHIRESAQRSAAAA